jgi:hypothetical protein
MAFQFSTGLRTARASQHLAQMILTTNGSWTASTAYTVGQTVINGGNTYRVTAAGTSAASGGPTGTGTSITDGTVTWTYAPPTLKIFSGAEPANAAASDPSGLLCTMQLPMNALAVASGVASLNGTWAGTASAAGTAASFRIYDPSGTNCVHQGNVTTDLVLNNTSIALNQSVSVSSYSVTDGNA